MESCFVVLWVFFGNPLLDTINTFATRSFKSWIIWVLDWLSKWHWLLQVYFSVIFLDHSHLWLGSDSLYIVHFKQWWDSFLVHFLRWSLSFWQMRTCKKNLTISIVQLYFKFQFPVRHNFPWDKAVSKQTSMSYHHIGKIFTLCHAIASAVLPYAKIALESCFW